ncbi:MAG: hypothetical protein OJF62_002754 [Pseudolabrys sp.]|jgi:hypothetical protein|nr:hypothetical protein [Pseudolabrys sp.]
MSPIPLQNRVDPFGDLIAVKARGTLMGNRGGRIHTDDRKLTSRRWASRQWICCVLDFKGRQRDVWGRFYTELFFLDEVTAFAAGHRPCFECRRRDAERFAALFASSNTVRPRESGDPESRPPSFAALDSRLHGNERKGGRLSAKAMDDILHAERLDGRAKRIHRRTIDALPDGAMIVRDGEPYAVRGGRLLRWTPRGYDAKRRRPTGMIVDVLTPPSILAVLKAGYAPQWHNSAG